MSATADLWPMASPQPTAAREAKSQLLPPRLRFRLWRAPTGAYLGTLQLPTGERFDIAAEVQTDEQGRRWFEGTVRAPQP